MLTLTWFGDVFWKIVSMGSGSLFCVEIAASRLRIATLTWRGDAIDVEVNVAVLKTSHCVDAMTFVIGCETTSRDHVTWSAIVCDWCEAA